MTQQSHYGACNRGNRNWERPLSPSVHCGTVHNSSDVEAALISVDRGTDKEAVVHRDSRTLLSYKKEGSWVHSEVDKPRAFFTEWSKSEKEISYIKAYIWNLERWYWWTSLKGRKGDRGIENSGGRRGTNGESSIHTLLYMLYSTAYIHAKTHIHYYM